ncbi:MAG: multi-sensor hybrid histidine kinase [Blastococcus sp.]|jgi:signal transduction histidine kinase/DNA-binding response OmpR family regulator/HPt (histidine-containing phosphotransfer) domain-containing protein|nr:multi-sensor hybrid histidine kinase [Blastococcus sp.]
MPFGFTAAEREGVASENGTPRHDVRPLHVLLRRPLLVALAGFMTAALTAGLAALVVTVLGRTVDRANLELSALQDGHIAMLNQESGLRGFVVTRDGDFLQLYRKGAADLGRLDAQLETWADADDDAELAEQVHRLVKAQGTWITEWARPTLLSQPQVSDSAAIGHLLRRNKVLFDQYRTVQADVRAVVETRRERTITRQQVVLVGLAGAGVVVTGAFAVAVRRASRKLAWQLLPPTRQVRDTLAALASGDVTSRAPENGPAELRDIAVDVNALGDALRQRDALVAMREEDLVWARDEAERAGHAKTAFLATMSHEIRTPLNAVLGLTDLLLTTELTGEQRAHLETISGSGDSLLTLINDILDFSKIEAGELDLEQAPFDLQGLLYDVAHLLAPQAAAKGLDLLVDIPGDCAVRAVGDGARLRQVVVNLVANAVKFTAEGQVVIGLSSAVSDDRMSCRLSVSDTGIGIPEHQRDRLFRSFSQGDASITRSYGGTGLGLAISQRIARAMGGDIAVDSSAGVGSTFTVTVDLGVAPAVRERLALDGLAGRRILVVDDNPTNLRILEHQLTRLGATCVLVGSGASALERLGADPEALDACILDLHMPDMDGAQLAARLRVHPQAQGVPLILLSSSTRLRVDSRALFAARLHKPVRPERLLQTMLSVLEPDPDSPRRHRTDADVRAGERPRLRVLVAEDHAVNAHLMELYLQQLGHHGEHVGNGRDAVEAVRRTSYDVVLMDAQMPVMGGVEATAAIRALPVPQPRILAVTASVGLSDRNAFQAAGADDFLTKPVRLATLDDALTSWSQAPATDPAATAPAPDLSPADGGALDAETVEELRDLGEAAFQHLYEQYVGTLDATVAAIVTAADGSAWSTDDDDSVPRLAHRLKGSSAALGAHRMADLCRRLEEQTRPDSPAVTEVLAELEEERRLVRAAVATLLDPR